MRLTLRPLAACAVLALLSACSTAPENAMKEPALSPVGSGLYQYPSLVQPAAFPKGGPRGKHSLWSDDRADFYHDPRALSVGDIVTVRINIKDEASLRNATDRTRESKVGAGLSLAGALGEWVLPDVGVDLEADGKSDAKGAGRISRSEDIKLSVAAVVTQELPNGNLMISGQQEMRVNFEVRVLSIAGIIRPRDILADNTIDYDKIAEARISYGGRGRVTDVQQPQWGQQVYDVVAPF
ncbi:MAG: flagellar basal body L-ring protein FlgH [Fulvimarina manganoxydans]|uniref:flagellar basal body L-ring protein FlgH n=1 Tax=Fulvimarina manganoxydans TaxID=937218 RepID=UPI0023560CAC|nr:flagellar basal body L-ring protein FlgH [Fulvimarina manganoxydans]MCK5933240.1 flagellar basal body L-ring protein FlgH [Fulvimarina manganoxydans]MEE2950478.1 flagellar basal body L-ring protein FlgH [Pseudomonadota bacterium]